MSARSTGLLARRSLRARLGRTAAIAFAIAVAVAFVVGSFVLADSLRTSIGQMFDELYDNVDLQVQSESPFDDEGSESIGMAGPREPLDPELAARLADVEGVEMAVPSIERYAQVIRTDDDGDEEALGTQGPPTLGVSWEEGSDDLAGVNFREGDRPVGGDQVALDTVTADRADAEVGDEVRITTDVGTDTYTMTGTFSLLDTEGFNGATVSLFDLETAMEVLGTDGKIDVIQIAVDDGADVDEVSAAIVDIADELDENVEVQTGEEAGDAQSDEINEIIDLFGNGLLIFAFITAFVGAFIINNVFTITIGQRLRELALLRAVGAGGVQVRRMITAEAIGVSVIGTIAGVGLGIVVARLLLALFDAVGAGFPDTSTVLLWRTLVIAAVVGVGITLASVVVPARRAARIPPVAAMQPERGYSSLRGGRLVLGTVVTTVGAVLFLLALFVQPGGTIGMGMGAGVGGLLIFLGVVGLSSTVARPGVRTLGAPFARLLGTAGQLARDNAGRAPRRTSSSAAALMVSVALVSGAAIFAASLRDTVGRTLDRVVAADYLVSNEAGPLPPSVHERMQDIDELGAVSPLRGSLTEIDGSRTPIVAADPSTVDALLDIDMREGSFDALADNGVLVHTEEADELGLGVGETVEVTFLDGESRDLTVAGIYGDNTVIQNWVVSLDTLGNATETTAQDFVVVASVAEGYSDDEAAAALETELEDFPQANVESASEYLESAEEQVDQILFLISALLMFATAIAVLGLSITLALGVFERTREIGMLRAVGMTKRQVRRTVRWEAVLVSLFGALIGIVVGSALGVVLAVASPDSIVDGVSFAPGMILVILAGAVAAGLVAALYPAAKASRMDILDAIFTE